MNRTLSTIKRKEISLIKELLLVLGFLVGVLFLTGVRYYWMTDFLIFIILVMSYDLIYGYMGHLSFGHMLYYGTGAYATGMWIVYINGNPLYALVFGVVVSAALAALAGTVAVRVKGAAFALLNMAFNELGLFIISSVIAQYTKGDDGLIVSPKRLFGIFRLGDDITAFIIVLIVFFAMFIILRVLTRSSYGILVKSISKHEIRVRFLGYKTLRAKWVTFVIASAIAGVAGGLFTLVQGFVTPGVMRTFANIDIIFAILIGGSGTLYGAIIGGVAFMLIKSYLPLLIVSLDRIVPFTLPQWEMWLGIILLIIVFTFRQGIVGLVGDRFVNLLKKTPSKKKEETLNV